MDLLGEHEKEIRGCFTKGAHKVQIDFTEGRLAVKIDPSGSSCSTTSFFLLLGSTADLPWAKA